MIWLRLFIAVIALTISSDLSAWGQPQKQINRNKRGRTISSAPSASAAPQVSAPSASTQPQQMQVNSPEGFYDCNGIANGANERDPVNDCCFRSQMNFCGRCRDNRSPCEKQSDKWCGTGATNPDQRCGCGLPGLVQVCGVCGYSMRGCESQRGCGNIDTVCGRCGPMQGCESVRGCGNIDTVCGSCTGTMGGCGRCSGCKDCKTFRCSRTKGSYWPMFHNTGTNCGSAFELPNNTGGPVNPGHGQQFYRVPLFSQPDPKKAALQKCYPEGPATCADTNKSGWIYATNNAGELVTIEEESGKKSCTCNDGTITCN